MNGLVGHIEDIVTHSEYRGHNLGKMVIETLKYIGEQTGCYKSISHVTSNFGLFPRQCSVLRQVRIQRKGVRNGILHSKE